VETRSSELKVIDSFIGKNRKVLAEMDQQNRKDICDYQTLVKYLDSSNSYDRKSAVREIVTTFLTDWE
jgi:hypothetical protein